MPRGRSACRSLAAGPTLALGGQLKATFALGRGRHAFLSHHIGDLDHYEAYRAYGEAIAHYERLFRLEPGMHRARPAPRLRVDAVCASSTPERVRLIAVQHHHAHVASCMAENGLDEPVIGVAFDGTGYGTDGAIWGGEFLVGDYRGFRRAAHLRPVVMPGGEQAIREPWRMAAAYLVDAGLRPARSWRAAVPSTALARDRADRSSGGSTRRPPPARAGSSTPWPPWPACATRSATRARRRSSWNGWRPTSSPTDVYPFEVRTLARATRTRTPLVVDTRPMIAEVAADVRRGVSGASIARRFHSTLVEIDRRGLRPAAAARPGWTRWCSAAGCS